MPSRDYSGRGIGKFFEALDPLIAFVYQQVSYLSLLGVGRLGDENG